MADWRRDNVNHMVQSTYDIIKGVKPWVQFGVSPIGIWRPGDPPGIVGMDSYEMLYADSKVTFKEKLSKGPKRYDFQKWLNEGWLDYFAPQLYWPIDSTGQPFEPLFNWWNDQNYESRFVVPGLYASGVFEHVKDWTPEEIPNQIDIIREANLTTAPGAVHYSMQAYEKNAKGRLTENVKRLN